MKQHRTRSDSFGLRDKIGYMMGDFGCNMSFQLVSSYAMIYFTQGMGLTLGSWAVIVVLAKIFDAINDPIIGALVDRRKPRKSGKFRPWIFYGSFAILLTTTLFFIDIRALSYGLRFAYCLTMYCLWSDLLYGDKRSLWLAQRSFDGRYRATRVAFLSAQHRRWACSAADYDPHAQADLWRKGCGHRHLANFARRFVWIALGRWVDWADRLYAALFF